MVSLKLCTVSKETTFYFQVHLTVLFPSKIEVKFTCWSRNIVTLLKCRSSLLQVTYISSGIINCRLFRGNKKDTFQWLLHSSCLPRTTMVITLSPFAIEKSSPLINWSMASPLSVVFLFIMARTLMSASTLPLLIIKNSTQALYYKCTTTWSSS